MTYSELKEKYPKKSLIPYHELLGTEELKRMGSCIQWRETKLRSFLAKAAKVAPESAAANALYQAWLEGLCNDCKEHIQELRDFLKED